MKTIYYAYVQKLEVPDHAAEKEIEDLVFNKVIQENGEEPVDYMWSEEPNLFDF
jgi:hypothetical protein